MKTLRFFMLLALIVQSFATTVLAKSPTIGFNTSQDLMNSDSPSGILLHNSGETATTVYGLYVRQLAYVSPGAACDSATVIYPSSSNITAGAMLMPTEVGAGKNLVVGKNYLYNMLFQAEYYENIIIPSFPPGCTLPGCTWGSDTTTYNWCIYLGALGPVSTSAGYTANVPPSAAEASSLGTYNYNLINSYTVLGPISCSDQTLTCTVLSQQNTIIALM